MRPPLNILWLLERSSQKNQLSSEKEKVNKLNKKNSEKTNASLAQRSFAKFHTERLQDKVEDLALRNSIQSRENMETRDISSTERLNRQENNSSGDDKQASVDKNERPVFQGEKSGLRSKEDTSEREVEKKGEPAIANETVLDKCSNKKQYVDKINGDQFHER